MPFAKEGSDLICPECGSGAKLVNSKIIYGKSYGLMWICNNYPDCDCYVGCHKGTATPLGELANADIREWRKKVHAKLDPLWKNKKYNRNELYEELGIKFKNPFHVGDLNVEQCKKAIKFIHDFYE
jgi:ssDNA-binding Zn-finger/Zn-ribbon topoisomerase 1